MSLLLAFAAVTATCTPEPSAAQNGPERVGAFIAAVNSRDAAAIGRFIRPGATYTNAQVPSMALTEVMTMLLGQPTAERLDVVEATAQSGGSILLRTRTPSGSTASAMVRLEGGCVAAFTQTQ